MTITVTLWGPLKGLRAACSLFSVPLELAAIQKHTKYLLFHYTLYFMTRLNYLTLKIAY